MRSRAVLIAALLVLSACEGPIAPLDIGSKEVPIDLLLGAKQKAVAAAPVPPIALPEEFGTFSAPTGTPFFTIPEEPQGPCPEADPLAVPKLEARNSVEKAPVVESIYPYRASGNQTTTTGTTKKVVPVPSTSSWKVRNVISEPTGGFTFDIDVTLGTAVTTSTYRILPTGAFASVPGVPFVPAPAPPNEAPKPNTGVPPGLYLAGIATNNQSKPIKFPAPGLPIVRFPIDRGVTFDASATDGDITMSWRSTVGPKVTVDACGTPIDTYQIELTMGRIVQASTNEVLDFETIYAFGTQYGGLPLSQKTKVTGRERQSTVERNIEMTINVEPKAP